MEVSSKYESLKPFVQNIAAAYAELETAKNDFRVVVEAQLEAMVASCPGAISKTDKKNIKKLAKSLADGGVDEVANEADSMSRLCEMFIQ